MTKRLLTALFFALACLLWSVDAAPQRRPVAPAKFVNFKHSSHVGAVKSLLVAGKSIELDCAYCHGTVAKDRLGAGQHDIQAIGYPSHKNAGEKETTHSSCIECHAFTGAKMAREMCAVCHQALAINPRVMATNLRRFPNPDGSSTSDFYDYFGHGNHVDYFEQYATATPLKDRIKFYDAKLDAAANKKRDKQRFECAACHTANTAPVTVAKIEFKPGVKMSAPGHPECFVCHFDAKIVSPPKPAKPDPKNTFATNCSGCHQTEAKPLKENRPVMGSELMTLWFARRIVNTELNPVKPGVKATLPFSHKTHDEAVGSTVTDCLSCHATAKTAATLADFYLEDRKTKEKQPLPFSCVDCHKKEMQTKIEGALTIEIAKCNYCHSLATIKEIATKGSLLPPPSHFGKNAAPIQAK